jgi:hypothetical protein
MPKGFRKGQKVRFRVGQGWNEGRIVIFEPDGYAVIETTRKRVSIHGVPGAPYVVRRRFELLETA